MLYYHMSVETKNNMYLFTYYNIMLPLYKYTNETTQLSERITKKTESL